MAPRDLPIGDAVGPGNALKALGALDTGSLVRELELLGRVDETEAAAKGYADLVGSKLSHNSPEVVAAAAAALGNVGGPAVIPQLAALLDGASPQVKASACKALGKFRAAAKVAVGPLAKVVTSSQSAGEEPLKVEAIAALGFIGAANEVDLLVSLLDHSSPDVVSAACAALGQCGRSAESRAGAIAAKLDDPKMAFGAISAFGGFSADTCAAHADALVKALGSDSAATRSAAVDVVGRLPKTATKVVGYLKDGRPGVRAAAAMALGQMGAQAAQCAGDLAKILSDDAEDRSWLAECLGGAAPRPPATMRKPACAALAALGLISAEAMAAAVAAKCGDPDWEVRACAVEALGRMGSGGRDQSVQVATSLDDDAFPVRAKACAALGAMRADEELPRLAEMLQDKSAQVRAEAALAIGAIGELGHSYCADVFVLLASEEPPLVRAAAVRALGRLGEASQGYVSIIAALLDDPDASTRAAVAEALSKMGGYGSAFASEVALLLQDPVVSVRAAAATALGDMGAEGAAYLRDAAPAAITN